MKQYRKIVLLSGALRLSGSSTWIINLHKGLTLLNSDVLHIVLGEPTKIISDAGQVFYTGRARSSWILRFLRIFQIHKLVPRYYESFEDAEHSRRINGILKSRGWSNLPLLVIKDFTSYLPSILRNQRVLSVIHHELRESEILSKNTSKQYFDHCWAVSIAARSAAVKQGLVRPEFPKHFSDYQSKVCQFH